MPRNIPTGAYKAGLLATTIIWGSSFVVLKGALDVVAPSWLLALRFGLAGVILALLCWRRLRDHLDSSHVFAGALIGLSGGLAYLVQNVGLVYTTPSKNAFLTATYCVMVPFLYWLVARKRPGLHNVVAALLCVVGVFLVTLGGAAQADLAGSLALGIGDVLTLVSALLFAVNIVQIARFAPGHDTLTLSAVQMFVFAGVCAIVGILVGDPMPAAEFFTPDLVSKLAYLVLMGTVFAIVMQNVGQKHVEPSQAALLMSFESVFGVIFSIIFYHEAVTPAMLVGFVAIFVSVLVSELSGTYNRRDDSEITEAS